MSRRTLTGSRGLTVVELLVVTGFLVILTLLVHETARVQAASAARNLARAQTQGDLRIWLSRMVKDIRQAGYDPAETGDFGILAFETDEIRFTADLDGNGVVGSSAPEYGGYRLNGEVLEAWLGDADWRPLAGNVTGLTLTYYDAAGQVLTTAENAASLVEIELAARTETGGIPGLEPPVIRRRASVELRNDVS